MPAHRTRKALEKTAYHEAGHAALALKFGFRIKVATIVPDDDSQGQVVHYPPGKWFRPDLEFDCRTELRLHRQIMVSLAGVMAEKMFSGSRADRFSGSSDFATVIDCAMWANGSTEATNALIRWLEIRTRDILKREWERVVCPIAEALLDRHTLNAKEIRTAVAAALRAVGSDCGAATPKGAPTASSLDP